MPHVFLHIYLQKNKSMLMQPLASSPIKQFNTHLYKSKELKKNLESHLHPSSTSSFCVPPPLLSFHGLTKPPPASLCSIPSDVPRPLHPHGRHGQVIGTTWCDGHRHHHRSQELMALIPICRVLTEIKCKSWQNKLNFETS